MSSESSSNNGSKKSKEEVWKEIYTNATQDREKASMLVTDLWKEITANPEMHVLYGGTITKYLERMNKSNDQLVKLAELMQKSVVEAEEEDLDLEDVYDKIDSKKIVLKSSE
jgi:hypothetical protein|tara:strand:- start:297 stop:632 length:336 start_codon:yes stop_codon:yes gene_type:complete